MPLRRPLCLLALLVVLTLAACQSPKSKTAARSIDRPNVVLIISDDHAWTDYGFMGHPHIRTPHLDRLASQSLTFSRGYVPSSLCCPSLASILTGRYPHEHQIANNDPPLPEDLRDAARYQSPEFSLGHGGMVR